MLEFIATIDPAAVQADHSPLWICMGDDQLREAAQTTNARADAFGGLKWDTP